MDAAQQIEMVKLDELDTSLQIRDKLDAAAIEDYAAMLKDGVELDPGAAFRLPNGRLTLAAGFHRL